MTDQQAIVITGGGPVGLVLALRLSRFGVPVIVLEKNPDVQNDLRASTFHPPTLEMLDDFDLTKGLLAAGLETPTWQIRMHETGEKAEFDLGVIAQDTRYPFRLQAEQRVLCQLATDLIADIDNIDLRMGHELTGFSQTGDVVSLQVTGADGEPYELTTPYLVAADGGKSLVRERLDLKFEGLTYPETTLLATTTFPFHDHIDGLSNVNYIWFEAGTFSLLRLPGLWRCSLYAEKDQSIEEALQPDNIEAKLQRIVATDTVYDVGEIRPYRIHQRILDDYRVGRIIFVGDAAHLNSPSGGMGMNGGIHDAWCLSEKLAPVWKGDEAIERIDHYTRQRQPIAKEQILVQAHKNRTRMQERDPELRREELARMQAIANDPVKARAHLLKSSMIEGLRRSAEIE
jgi:2-polyprenyl-6-methoxyphenol hydroxylase-like FAD-dependent oxidoreductase